MSQPCIMQDAHTSHRHTYMHTLSEPIPSFRLLSVDNTVLHAYLPPPRRRLQGKGLGEEADGCVQGSHSGRRMWRRGPVVLFMFIVCVYMCSKERFACPFCSCLCLSASCVIHVSIQDRAVVKHTYAPDRTAAAIIESR